MKKRRCLVVDDNDDFRELLRIAFEGNGWEVFAAQDGRDALRVYHNAIENDGYFDALILDITMPRLNGIAVGLNVRNLEKFAEIPRAVHVYLTGHDKELHGVGEELADLSFADAYMCKPVSIDGLIGKINELVENR